MIWTVEINNFLQASFVILIMKKKDGNYQTIKNNTPKKKEPIYAEMLSSSAKKVTQRQVYTETTRWHKLVQLI